MTESIITLSLVGLIVGFIFSMPIAGPISILITSNALKGRLRYCNLVTVGASFADFVYVFAAVFGLTNFYSLYQPFIPYVLLLGTVFLVVLGIKISKTKVDIEHMDDKPHLPHIAETLMDRSSEIKDMVTPQAIKKETKVVKEHGAFWTGFMLSFFNPTLFISWLTSSFIVISFITSLGFNTGGLEKTVEESYKAINKTSNDTVVKSKALSYLHLDSVKLVKREPTEEELEQLPSYSTWVLSASYAFFLAVGSIVWFVYLAYILSKNRHRININVINRLIQYLGYVLCIFGLVLGYKGINMLM